MSIKISCFLTNVLKDLEQLLENFEILVRNSNGIENYVFVVRDKNQETLIDAFIKENLSSLADICYKIVVNSSSYLSLDAIKNLNNDFLLVIPDTIKVKQTIIQKLTNSCSDPSVSFAYLNLTKNKVVNGNELIEDHRIYSIFNEQPDVLDCYTIALIKNSLLNYVDCKFSYTYFFRYLAH